MHNIISLPERQTQVNTIKNLVTILSGLVADDVDKQNTCRSIHLSFLKGAPYLSGPPDQLFTALAMAENSWITSTSAMKVFNQIGCMD